MKTSVCSRVGPPQAPRPADLLQGELNFQDICRTLLELLRARTSNAFVPASAEFGSTQEAVVFKQLTKR